MLKFPIHSQTIIFTTIVTLVACSNNGSDDKESPLEIYVGEFKAVSVTVLEDKCNMGATSDENPQIGDTINAYISDDRLRLITDECLPPEEPNCIDHFPEQWTIADGFIENKHVDDLYEGNPDKKKKGECFLTAYSHWKAVMNDNTMQITLTIRTEPYGKDCTPFETSLIGCEIVLSVMLERQ